MSYAFHARPVGPVPSDSHSAVAAHRGDVTTVQAVNYVGLEETKRVEKIQSHSPSHRTAGTTAVPIVGPKIIWA